MTDKSLSSITDGGALAEGDIIYIVRSGNSRRASLTAAGLADLLDASFLTPAEAAAAYQPLDSDLTAIAALGTTAFGRALLELANAAAASSALGLGTGDSPQFTAVNIGHATDTTITRVSAGNIAVEGNAVYRASGTDVPVADGGSGRSTATAYAVICGGTTSTGAHQSIASVGTSGQVLTSNGAGALPTFQTLGSSGMVLLSSGTVSSAATLDVVLTSYTTYRGFRLELTQFVPASDDVELWLRLSQDGGSSYVSSGYKWLLERNRSGGTTPAGNTSTSDAQIKLIHSAGATEMVSNTASEGGADVTIDIWGVTASVYPKVRAQAVWYAANADLARSDTVGVLPTADAADAIRILFESGDIASGKWALYGYA